MNLETAKALHFVAHSFSTLLLCHARRSGPRFSVDWQAWGTKGGLCWRATRDGLRHVPAGPPKSCAPENLVTPLPRDTRKLRLSAPRATICARYVSQSIQVNTARETAPSNRNPLFERAPSAGAGENALFPSRGFIARGVLGVSLQWSPWARFTSLGLSPRGVKTPAGRIQPPVKPCQGVPHARARVGKFRFFDHPYNLPTSGINPAHG